MNAKNTFGAICLAAALFFLWPSVFGSWAQMRALRTALQERRDLLAQREEILREASAQYVKYEAVKKSELATVFASLIPTKKDTAEIVSAASSIAATSGMQLTKIDISDESGRKSKDPYATLTLSLELKGSYAGLKSFLRDLETYVRLLNVQRIEISSNDQSGMSFTVEAHTYCLK